MYKIWAICRHQFRAWWGNPRVIAACVVCIGAALFHTVDMAHYAASLDEGVQFLEPYIYSRSERAMATLSFMGLILLLADAPFTEQSATYALTRVGRRSWVGGKLLYILLACVAYEAIALAVSGLWVASQGFAGNVWSFPFYQISFYGTPKLLFENSAVLQTFSPFGAAALSLLLTVLYHFTVGLLLFRLNLTGSRVIGFAVVGAWHCLGYLWGSVSINRLFGFTHSLLSTHAFDSFWGAERAPGVGESCVVLAVLILLLTADIFYAMRRVDLKITVGEVDNG